MTDAITIVGLGEALFDVFPHGKVLGGAPLNVAVQAHQLLAPAGGQGVVVSRVGRDDLGQALTRTMTERGMCCDRVQTDSTHPKIFPN